MLFCRIDITATSARRIANEIAVGEEMERFALALTHSVQSFIRRQSRLSCALLYGLLPVKNARGRSPNSFLGLFLNDDRSILFIVFLLDKVG